MKPLELHEGLSDGREIALLDVREAGQFGEGHLFFAVPLPFSRMEIDVPRLVPRKGTRIVLCDDGSSGVAAHAMGRMRDIGYTSVGILEGGTEAWAADGFPVYKGVNVPSKTFGELIEHACHTPRITAAELAAMQAARKPHVLLDGRPLAEFRKMSIPGATCCPNGELAYRIGELVRDDTTPIVVNCAGRTRSIVGAQTLIDMGVRNPVYALENGTQGWYLADFALEHGQSRPYPQVSPSRDLGEERARARSLAQDHGARFIPDAEAQSWLDDPRRTTFLFDVRTPEEFAAGTVAGAVHAPGGQLIQATDQWVGVRGARMLLLDSDGIRAAVTASWLRRLGHDAHVLEKGIACTVRAPAWHVALPSLESTRAGDGATVLDVRGSLAYRKAHVPGSTWTIRPRFAALADRIRGRDVALVADDDGVARIAAHDLAALGARSVKRLADPPLTESSPGQPPDADCIDHLWFVHDRHDGNKEAARNYLAWETQLLSQLSDAERGSFCLK